MEVRMHHRDVTRYAFFETRESERARERERMSAWEQESKRVWERARASVSVCYPMCADDFAVIVISIWRHKVTATRTLKVCNNFFIKKEACSVHSWTVTTPPPPPPPPRSVVRNVLPYSDNFAQCNSNDGIQYITGDRTLSLAKKYIRMFCSFLVTRSL